MSSRRTESLRLSDGGKLAQADFILQAIAELTSALQILDPDNPNNFYGSLQNTSYHQLRLKPTSSFAPTSEQVSSAKSSIGADIPEQTFLPDLEIPVKVELIRSGVVDHLKSLHRHTAYVKSAEEKAKTAEKEKFFGGVYASLIYVEGTESNANRRWCEQDTRREAVMTRGGRRIE